MLISTSLQTGMQVHFMVHSEKHWTQIHALETKKRMQSMKVELYG